ncbi:MAG: right-handed parallel beta-helix repeat-containing protein [Thermoplasmata archaeon]|nr:right-handed parallel beta-helix repeat-containing protein [Thermoplasmata archaeon]
MDNNTVEEEPIVYIYGYTGGNFEKGNIAELIIANCKNFSVYDVKTSLKSIVGYSENLEIMECAFPILKMVASKNCKIFDCEFKRFSILHSIENKIFNCTIEGNVGEYTTGLYLEEGKNNTIKNCTIRYHYIGVSMIYGSTGNSVIRCNISNNEYGIYTSSSGNYFSESNISQNNIGIGIYTHNKNEIINNYISHNEEGVIIMASDENKIEENEIVYNKYGIKLYASLGGGKRNLITGNIFLGNEKFHALIYFGWTTIAYNIWNGNYWDNWLAPIPKPIVSQEGLLGTYFISWLNVDWKPLKNPPFHYHIKRSEREAPMHIITPNGIGIGMPNISKAKSVKIMKGI